MPSSAPRHPKNGANCSDSAKSEKSGRCGKQKTRSSQGTASPDPNESKKRRGSCACRGKFSKQSRRRVCKNAENELRAAEREECQHFAAAAIRRTGSLHNSPAKAAVAKPAASTAAAAKNARLHPVPMVHSVLIRASSAGCSANLPFSCAGCSVPSDDCPSPAVNAHFRGPQQRLL